MSAAAKAVADESEGAFCRFCWDNENIITNPMLKVCKCSGGVGFVHFVCLK